MPFNLGPLELAIILLIVLLVFGPKRLPGLGKQLGTGMREFKESITGKSGDGDEQSRGTSEREAPPGIEPAKAPSPEAVSAKVESEERPAEHTDA
jgi:sec-independent protein translocase protein TatA